MSADIEKQLSEELGFSWNLECGYWDRVQPSKLGEDFHFSPDQTNPILWRALVSKQQQIEELKRENARFQKSIIAFEEREASVCPEDVGCDEFIPILQAENASLRKRNGMSHKCFCKNPVPNSFAGTHVCAACLGTCYAPAPVTEAKPGTPTITINPVVTMYQDPNNPDHLSFEPFDKSAPADELREAATKALWLLESDPQPRRKLWRDVIDSLRRALERKGGSNVSKA